MAYRNSEHYADPTAGAAMMGILDRDIKFTMWVKPRTKKNHSRVVNSGGRVFVVPSDAYKRYHRECLAQIPEWAKKGVRSPVNVRALYYMETARKVDITNLESALMDVLVDAGVLADDSALSPRIVVSTDGSRVYHDKLNPRIEVLISPV